MIKTQEISGKIVCGEDIISGTIIFEDIIKDLKFEKNKNYTNYIIPGFVDLHCHGGNGYDSMEGLQSIKKISEYHLSHGTTTLYPTTVTAKLDNTLKALKGLNNYLNLNKEISNIDGIHLEGPFINPNKMGAQPPFAQLPSYSFVKTLMKEAPIKIMTIAPEIKGDLNLPQAVFQGMISGEDVVVPVKYQTPKSLIWTTPGFLAGNETPNYVDNSGSLSRRLLIWTFMKKVSKDKIDPKLGNKLKKEIYNIRKFMCLQKKKF